MAQKKKKNPPLKPKKSREKHPTYSLLPKPTVGKTKESNTL